MKSFILLITVFFVSSFSKTENEHHLMWGFYGHKKINNLAIYSLPPAMFGFYKENIKEITERAVNPDKRRHAIANEAPKHYIDLDHYCSNRLAVFDSVPRKWKDAVEKFSEDTLLAYGTVPWTVNQGYYNLIKAFQNKDWTRVITISADLGHYIADAHVPLHTTENYNGQLTNQKGVHGFWESRLPELFSDEYHLFVGKAQIIENPQYYIWERLKESHLALDSVLAIDFKLRNGEDAERMYSFEPRGNNIVKTYSLNYASQYHQMLDGMVERRMKSAIFTVSSYWYTAWVMAGQPNLPSSFKMAILAEDSFETIKKTIEVTRIHE
jgi:hypothetical protein